MASEPIVSIGLPVYNGATHIETSIRGVLGQTLENLELVISDNASDDGTEEICRSLAREDSRITYHRNATNEGAAANFNRVFHLSSAPYFKWLGHDDLLFPTAMEKSLAVMEERDDVSIVHWLERMTDETGKILREYRAAQAFSIDGDTPGRRFRQMLLWRSHGFAGDPFFGLIRRSALNMTRLQGKGANPNYLLMQELSLTGKFVTIPEVFAVRVYNDKRVSVSSMIRWLDPQAKMGLPHFTRAREYFKVGLTFGPMSPMDRILTAATLIGYHLHPRELKGFLWDLSTLRPRVREQVRSA